MSTPPYTRRERLFTGIVCFYVTLLIAATLAVPRILAIDDQSIPSGVFVYPFAYTAIAVIAITYGPVRAYRVAWFGFVCVALLVILMVVLYGLPAVDLTDNNHVNLTSLGTRIMIVSFLSNMAGLMTVVRGLTILARDTVSRHPGLAVWLSLVIGRSAALVLVLVLSVVAQFPDRLGVISPIFAELVFLAVVTVLSSSVYPLCRWIREDNHRPRDDAMIPNQEHRA